MSALLKFVARHAIRGACQCGKCADAPADPASAQPAGHTADVVFFKVSAKYDPSADEFRRLVVEHRGEFGPCDPLDGDDHNYMELGGWIGDQGAALMTMGLGALLGVWKLVTPKTLFGDDVDDKDNLAMAQRGMLWVKKEND